VYLGIHEQLNRKVAIKVLHDKYAENKGLRERFKNEASALAHMQHPNIVALYDYVENEDGLFLIMEYVSGMELDQHINTVSGPIPNDEAKQIMGQILDGFEYAHDQGIIHRDIKPSNIILTDDKKVKILDFGIAKIIEGDLSLTTTGTQMGTVLYMSPEQVKAQKLDKRSDIYSLGVTLFQMVTGKCPYDQNSAQYDVYNQIVNDELPKPSSIYPGVSRQIDGIIAKATAKNKENRYDSCAAFKQVLSAAEDSTEETPTIAQTVAVEPSSPPQPKKKKKNGLLIALAIVLPLLAGSIALMYASGWMNSDTDAEKAFEDMLNEAAVEMEAAVGEMEEEVEEEVEEPPLTIDDVDLSNVNFTLKPESDVVKDEDFRMELTDESGTEGFELDVDCENCKSFTNSNLKGRTSADWVKFNVYLKENSRKRWIRSETFATKDPSIINETPVKTARAWVESWEGKSMSFEDGYKLQKIPRPNFTDYNVYYNGYHTTSVVINNISKGYSTSSEAFVEIEYEAYDSATGKCWDLHQEMELNYYGAVIGWKVVELKNLSAKPC